MHVRHEEIIINRCAKIYSQMLQVYERALRCQVQNMSNASALRQAVMSHCYRQVL